jgi:twitching motility protein PilT
MAQLDRFLAVLVTNHGTALHLVTDDVAKLEIGGTPRPITRQPFTSAQVLGLLREISTPDVHRLLERGEPASFSYACEDGTFTVAASTTGGRLTAMLSPMSNEPPSSNGHARPVTIDTTAVGTTASADAARVEIEALLRRLVELEGSDLHLRVGEPPIIRQHGEMTRLESAAPLTNDRLEAMLLAIMPDRNRHEYGEINDTDFAYEITGVARFRCNALRDRKGAGAVARVIPATVVTADQLGLSTEVQQLCYLTKGLVLVTGPTGSGKSTTLCALVDLINRMRTDHVITIEDPIEFVHESHGCLVNHREVGTHTKSFSAALRGALREDPDIILVGEMRDLETIRLALEASNTGHLVLATLHTTSAPKTIDRVIEVFPAEEQAQVRNSLSTGLKLVVAQNLFKRVDRRGRVAALEILVSTTAVANLIRENKSHQLPSMIQTGKKFGMQGLDDAIMEHLQAGRIGADDAYDKSLDKDKFLPFLKTPPEVLR